MSNKMIRNVCGIGGMLLACWHMGLMFFGCGGAVWGAAIGLISSCFALVIPD